MKRIATAILASLLLAGCGGSVAGGAGSGNEGGASEALASKSNKACSDYFSPQEIYTEEGKLSEADKAKLDKDGDGQYCDEPGVKFKTVADTVQKAEIGNDIEQQQYAGSGKVIGVWQIHSAHIDQQRKVDSSYGSGMAEGPFLVMDVSFKHMGKGYEFVGTERLRIFTSHTIIDPTLEDGDGQETYGFRDGEWYSFGDDEVGPGITERGLVIVELGEDERPRWVKVFSESAVSAESYPIAKVNLSGVH